MRVVNLIVGIVGASGIASLGWFPNPDIFLQWLTTAVLTLTAILVAWYSLEQYFNLDGRENH